MAQHLRAWIAYSAKDFGLYYGQTRSGVEIDFVVYGRGSFWVIEVKNSAGVRRSKVRPLREFAADYPECEPLLLYRGLDRLEVGEIRCVPVDQFLRQLRPGRSHGGALTHLISVRML
ncbi:MAG: hypothetical protein ACRD1R_00895 [Acidobacteriota bacterium]